MAYDFPSYKKEPGLYYVPGELSSGRDSTIARTVHASDGVVVSWTKIREALNVPAYDDRPKRAFVAMVEGLLESGYPVIFDDYEDLVKDYKDWFSQEVEAIYAK